MRTRMHRKKSNRVTAIALSAAMLAGLCGCGEVNTNVKAETETTAAGDIVGAEEAPILTIGEGDIATADTPSKNETVYVLAGADGTTKQVIVSDWLSGSAGDNAFADVSELTNIEALKGNPALTEDGSSKVWNASMGDVYYRGDSNAELPVAVHVTYTLDGEEIAPEALAGKSGKVTIRFDYEILKEETVTIEGEEEKIHVPFLMITGALLDSKVFSNVTVTNGRMVNDGSRLAVVGLALPGIKEDLGIDSEKLPIPEYVEITADVRNFSMEMTVTLATNAIFRALDIDKLISLGDVEGLISQVTDAMTKLEDGSKQLYEGLNTLLEGAGPLGEGVGKLADGSSSLKDGAASAAAGAGQLAAGAASLKDGLATLDANSEALREGAKKVFESLLAQAQTQLSASGATIPDLTMENYGQVLDGVAATLTAAGQSAAVAQVKGLKASLDEYKQFYEGIGAYTAGVSQAAAGAGSLVDGANALKAGNDALAAGSVELYNGLTTLRAEIPLLTIGVRKLTNGAKQLSDGIGQFDDQAVKKIVDVFNGEITSILDRVKELVRISNEYNNFSGIAEGMDGDVKFIIRTAEIGK